MDQLIERVLTIGPGLTPVDRAGVVVGPNAVERDVLAVALHGQLLEVGGEALQILLIRQYSDGLSPEEIVVPDGKQAHQHRQVALKRRRVEKLADLNEAD